MPSAVAFLAYLPTTIDSSSSGVSATQFLGKRWSPAFPQTAPLSIIYNTGGGFYGGDGYESPAVFTAPSSGIYWFIHNINFSWTSGGSVGVPQRTFLAAPTRTYQCTVEEDFGVANWNMKIVEAVSLNLGEKVYFQYELVSHFYRYVGGGTAANPITWVAGYKM